MRRVQKRGNFEQWMIWEGYAPRTVQQYVRMVERVAAWLKDNDKPRIEAGEWQNVSEFASTLPLTHASRWAVRGALIAYGLFLGKEDFVPKGAVRVPRQPKMRSRALEEDELDAVLVAARALGPTYYASVCCMYYAALRREEVATLRWVCFEEDGWLRVVGKGLKEARLPVHPELARSVSALPRRPRNPYVFPGRMWSCGEHLSPATLNQRVKHVSAAAGLGVALTPHRLRHTALTIANDQTGDLRAVQDFARHENPIVTSGYTRTGNRRLWGAVMSLTRGTEEPPDPSLSEPTADAS